MEIGFVVSSAFQPGSLLPDLDRAEQTITLAPPRFVSLSREAHLSGAA